VRDLTVAESAPLGMEKSEDRRKSSGVRDRFVHLQYFGLLQLDVLFVRGIIIER